MPESLTIPPRSFVRIRRAWGRAIPPSRVGELAYVPHVGVRGHVDLWLRGAGRVISLPGARAREVLEKP